MSRVIELTKELLALLEKEETENECDCACETENVGVQLSELVPGELFEAPVIGAMKVLEHFADGTTAVIQNDFYEENVIFDGDCCDYTKSALKKKFDDEIAAEYKGAFGDALVPHTVDLKSVDMQDYGTFDCVVRPITFDEARKYNALLVKEDLPEWWWTCTPWSTKDRGWRSSVTVVSPHGYFDLNGCVVSRGVRPFCILKSNIFVSKKGE